MSHSAYLAATAGYKVIVSKGGNIVKAAPQVKTSRPKVGGGKRGKVRGFSAASRRRLREKFDYIANDALRGALLVHLTYPAAFPDCDGARKHRRALEKRIRRRWPRAAFIWRLELQSRGAPHFHIMVLGVPFIAHEWLARAWYEVVGSGDEAHLVAGTRVERAAHERAARSYLEKHLKYLSKQDQSEGVEGRSWGVVGTEAFHAPTVEAEMTGRQVARLARVLDGVMRARLKSYIAKSNRPIRSRRFRRRSMVYKVPDTDDGHGRELLRLRSLRWRMDAGPLLPLLERHILN